MKLGTTLLVGLLQFVCIVEAQADITVATGFHEHGLGFAFKSVPAPASNDAATDAKFSVVDGSRDVNGGDPGVLHDGRVPANHDQPSENFFFSAGTDGGRIQIDLGKIISVKQVNSYSWHGLTRGPQVYKLYAANGTADNFSPAPKKGTDPATCGWILIANVDTRPKDGDGGGQYGVAITNGDEVIGKYRYLLVDASRTEARDPFGNTFFSEIDVIDANGPEPISTVQKLVLKTFDSDDGKFHYSIDVTEAPDMANWAGKELKQVILEWYPKIVAMLPSEGYAAPSDVTFRFRSDMGNIPASATGASVNLNLRWFRGERDREALGCVVHEMVHVVQNYWRPRRDRTISPTPGWLIEGIPDYIRWFLYEPQSKGAEITKGNLASVKYDGSYRVSGNFLDWVTRTYDQEIVRKLNAAAREGNYTDELWKDLTGKTVKELEEEWKSFHEKRLNEK
ncbi:MAG: basic secretory protein-like protein [Schlesneria sp.]